MDPSLPLLQRREHLQKLLDAADADLNGIRAMHRERVQHMDHQFNDIVARHEAAVDGLQAERVCIQQSLDVLRTKFQ